MALFMLMPVPVIARGDTTFENISASDSYALIEENRGKEGFSILDVRTPEEFKAGRIEGSENIDYYADDFKAKLENLDKDRTYFIYCRSGNRSGRVLKLMEEIGFERVYNLRGGIQSWLKDGFPVRQ